MLPDHPDVGGSDPSSCWNLQVLEFQIPLLSEGNAATEAWYIPYNLVRKLMGNNNALGKVMPFMLINCM